MLILFMFTFLHQNSLCCLCLSGRLHKYRSRFNVDHYHGITMAMDILIIATKILNDDCAIYSSFPEVQV